MLGKLADRMRLEEFRQRLDMAGSRAELYRLLVDLDAFIPSVDTETPFFRIVPPAADDPGEWPSRLSGLGLDHGRIRRMLEAGWMPLDRRLLAQRTLSDVFGDPGAGSPYALLDPDYGIAIFDAGAGLSNLALIRATIERHTRATPQLGDDPALFFYQGAYRARGVLNVSPVASSAGAQKILAAASTQQRSESPVEVSLDSRQELDEALDCLRECLARYPGSELWLRGQASEYWVPELESPGVDDPWPWRRLRQPWLLPGLFREEARNGWGDLAKYALTCLEYGRYSSFLDVDLDLSPWSATGDRRLANEWYGFVPPLADHTGRTYDGVFHDLQRSFFLQHYGLPSGVLDITSDTDVALFFAQHAVIRGRYVPVDFSRTAPVVYVFILVRGLDLFLDSEHLSRHYGLERPRRQRCGLISGASLGFRNPYARLVAFRIKLAQPMDTSARAEDLFPPAEEDAFLGRLLEFARAEKAVVLRPFVPAREPSM